MNKKGECLAGILPMLCQLFATVLASFCHTVGKVLPTVWQSLANALAKSGKFSLRKSGQ